MGPSTKWDAGSDLRAILEAAHNSEVGPSSSGLLPNLRLLLDRERPEVLRLEVDRAEKLRDAVRAMLVERSDAQLEHLLGVADALAEEPGTVAQYLASSAALIVAVAALAIATPVGNTGQLPLYPWNLVAIMIVSLLAAYAVIRIAGGELGRHSTWRRISIAMRLELASRVQDPPNDANSGRV